VDVEAADVDAADADAGGWEPEKLEIDIMYRISYMTDLEPRPRRPWVSTELRPPRCDIVVVGCTTM
jgi:hypothetical protein